MLRQNQEDYLRAIYALYENSPDKNISSVDVAQYMQISKAAVSKMLKKMNTQGIIMMNPYSRIRFTSVGIKAAEKLTYKHRIIEVFLLKILNIEKRNIHNEAHKLEHAFSDESIKKLANFLGNPENCPCGHKIPKIK